MQRERASSNDSIQSTDHDTKRPRVDDESTALEAGMWRCRICGWKNRTENEICGGMGGSKAAAGGKKYGCGAPRMLSYTLDPSPIDVMPQQQQPSTPAGHQQPSTPTSYQQQIQQQMHQQMRMREPSGIAHMDPQLAQQQQQQMLLAQVMNNPEIMRMLHASPVAPQQPPAPMASAAPMAPAVLLPPPPARGRAPSSSDDWATGACTSHRPKTPRRPSYGSRAVEMYLWMDEQPEEFLLRR